MKKSAVVLALVAVIGLSACSSTGTKDTPIPGKTVITDFTDSGVQITYTSSGKLEKIEVSGQAFTNRGDFQTLAEANAKAKLVQFIHGEQVNSNKYVRILTKSIEKAQEKAKDYRSGAVNTSDKEFEDGADSGAGPDEDNVNRQAALRLNATITNNVTTIVSGGRLTAVRKVRDEFRKDGAIYVAVFAWTDKDQDSSEYVRSRMR